MTSYKLAINKHKLLNIILLSFIYLFLEIGYITFVVPNYSYTGFSFSFDVFKYFEAKLLFIVISCCYFFINAVEIISKTSVFLIFFFLIPNLILYQFADGNHFIPYANSLLIIAVIFISKVKSLLPQNRSVIKQSQQLYFLLLLSVLCFIPVFAAYGTNISFKALLFKDIYEIRAMAKGKEVFFSGYFFNWLAKIILPILIVYSISLRKYLITSLGIILLLYLYLTTAHKTVFLSLFIIIGIYLLAKYKNFDSIILIGILALITIVQLIDVFNWSIMPASLFIRRMLFVPAQLNIHYFDFFDEKPVYWAHSVLGRFIEYPYDLLPNYLIGKEYFGKAAMSANNGLISDGFMNLGYIGILINILILSLFFHIIANIKLPIKYFGIIIIIIYSNLSSYLTTFLLTHGGGLLILLLILFFRNEESKNKIINENT